MAEKTGQNDELAAVREDLAALRQDVEALVRSASASAADKGRETYENLKERGQQGADAFVKQVEARPMASVAGAFGIGLLIGFLTRR